MSNTEQDSVGDEQMSLTAMQYRDELANEFTQVTASCACGRGGWIRLPKHADLNQHYLNIMLEIIHRIKVDDGKDLHIVGLELLEYELTKKLGEKSDEN